LGLQPFHLHSSDYSTVEESALPGFILQRLKSLDRVLFCRPKRARSIGLLGGPRNLESIPAAPLPGPAADCTIFMRESRSMTRFILRIRDLSLPSLL
jgi:hypothetical protein